MDMEHNQIEPKKIKGVGLVFARREDPISHFSLAITKQLYSVIGFYYTTKVSGSEKVNVVLSDISEIVSSGWMNPFTIEKLINDPLISQLSIRRLLPVLGDKGLVDEIATAKRDGEFKSSIAKVTQMGPETSVREWVKQLFGYEISQPTAGSTSVELVNRVILDTGNWDKIEQNGSMSMEGLIKNQAPEIIPKTSEGTNVVFGKIGSEFKQIEPNNPNTANKLIQSYLGDNGVFGPLKHIKLPPREELNVNLERERYIGKNKKFLTEAVSVFVKMLLEDKKFFNVVVDGINHHTMINSKIDEKFRASVFDTIQSGSSIVSILVSMIERGRVNFKDLEDVISKYNYKMKNTLSIIEVDMNHLPNIDECEDKIVVFEHCNQSKFDVTLKQLHTQVQDAIKAINDDEIPIMNINVLATNINHLIELSGSKLDTIKKLDCKKAYNGVFNTSKNAQIPVQFKSGKRVVLTTVGSDLSRFNCGELRELMCATDVMSNGDDDFDDFRSKIVDIYSSCKNSSCEYHH